jgi:hypothetical protein
MKDASDSEISLKNKFTHLATNMLDVASNIMKQEDNEIIKPTAYG